MAIDWSTRVKTRFRNSWSSESGCVCSASRQTRSIASITSTGYLQLARHVHVCAGLRERHRQVISLDLGRGPDVLHVLGSERRRSQAAALAVDALVVRKYAAMAHARVHFGAVHFRHFEHDLAVVQQ